MAKPTLQNIFGPNASQTATDLIIKKSDLTGLTASATNEAEDLLTAIVQIAALNATQTAWSADTDRTIFLDLDNAPQIALQGTLSRLVYQAVISLGLPLSGAAKFADVDPDLA